MKKTLLLIYLCVLSIGSAFAQEKSLTEITEFKLKNSGSFMDKNNDVDGYYFFYEVDKLKKGQREYAIKMLDNNLNDIATKSYIDDKDTYLLQSKFNNQALMFIMINLKNEFCKLVTFDKQGNRGEDVNVPVSKREIKWLASMINMDIFNFLYPIDNKGFLFTHTVNNKKYGYKLKYVPTDGGVSWDYNSPEDAKEILTINPIGVSEEIVVAIEGIQKSVFSSSFEGELIGLDINSGSVLFRKDVYKSEDPRLITNAFITKDKKIILLGEYYAVGDNAKKDKSEGLYTQVIDFEGKVISDKKLSWESDINIFMPKNKNGEVNDKEYVYFHEIIHTQKGGFYAVGEKYKKTASAAGILLGGNSKTQLTITDALIFELDEQFDLKNIKVIEKGKSRIPSFSDFISPQMNAHLMKSFGAFDYEFTQIDIERDRFYANFIDYERLKGEENKLAFKTIMYNEGKLSEDKIYLQKDSGKIRFKVLPAKLGHVMLLEYNKKEKTLQLHLEKLNVQ